MNRKPVPKGVGTMNRIVDTTRPGKHDRNDMQMDMPMDRGNQDKGVDMEMMGNAFSLNLQMERHGSGTGWLTE